ncbi:MAG: hypothetical protein ACRC6H_01580 [Culicoidibacterales bacterium]
MISITFADQSTLKLTPEQTLTFWMHSNFKLTFERGMNQSMVKLAEAKVETLETLQLLALTNQSTCFTIDYNASVYYFTQAIIKISV